MVHTRTAYRYMSAIAAPLFAGTAVVLIHRFWEGIPQSSMWIIFFIFTAGFYLALVWIAVDRPAELDKKYPISSHEHRKRRREFYQWLNSLERRK